MQAHPRYWPYALILALGVLARPDPAAAQTTAQNGAEGEGIEIVLNLADGEARCRPAKVQLPSHERVEIRFINRSDIAMLFVAPKFFDLSEIIETRGFVSEPGAVGFVTAPGETGEVVLRTPSVDEYGYSCRVPGALPNPKSSGFLIVGPAGSQAVDIPPRLDDDTADPPSTADQ